MKLTKEEIRILLDALMNQYGVGYNHDPMIGNLQAQLSIELALLKAKEEAKLSIELALLKAKEP